jgi:hypothetical protein
MNLKESYETYYKPLAKTFLKTFFIMFLISFILAGNTNIEDIATGLLVVAIMSIVLAILCGGIYHWFFEVYRPKKAKSLFEKISTLNFSEAGLKLNLIEEVFEGHYKGYYTLICTDTETDGNNYIKAKIFIKVSDDLATNYKKYEKLITIEQSEEFSWVERKVKFKSKVIPSEESIINEIEKTVIYLKENNIEADEIK